MEGNNEGKEQATEEQEYEDLDSSEFDEEDLAGQFSEEDDTFGGSIPEPLGGIYGLFKDVLKEPDTKRVSNLTKEELGVWDLSVRDCERIALIARTFNHKGVAKFFENQSRIITDTSMSKSGWFTELFVTSKKYASRSSSSNVSNLPQSSKKNKWKIFSNKEEARQPQEMV